MFAEGSDGSVLTEKIIQNDYGRFKKCILTFANFLVTYSRQTQTNSTTIHSIILVYIFSLDTSIITHCALSRCP